MKKDTSMPVFMAQFRLHAAGLGRACSYAAGSRASAAAVEIADVALGHLRSNRLLRVLSPVEMQKALRQAGTAPDIAPKPT